MPPLSYNIPVIPRGNRNATMSNQIRQYPHDPRIFLMVRREWYYYNPNVPPIGSGAMGVVYQGFSCIGNQPVAIKAVRYPYYNNPQIRERAREEASLAFRHQNLIEMLGYCEYAPNYGPIYLVSNFVQGEAIDKYSKTLAESPMRIEKICFAICAVLDALDFIHAHNLVHRDVKPSNIMVENNSNVRLMDLGIAKINTGNPYSHFGFIGTPEYSAPEQIRGERVCIDKTTDIYALGITFYELLTGVNPMSCAIEADTLKKQMTEPLPSSSKIPRKLFKVILKATEKEQSKRYQTAQQFKIAIQDAIQPSPSIWVRLGEWINDKILIFIGVMVLFIFAISTVIFIFKGILWS